MCHFFKAKNLPRFHALDENLFCAQKFEQYERCLVQFSAVLFYYIVKFKECISYFEDCLIYKYIP